MSLLEQAQALLANDQEISIDTARQLNKLEAQASAAEQAHIASLWEAFITAADEATFNQAYDEGLI